MGWPSSVLLSRIWAEVLQVRSSLLRLGTGFRCTRVSCYPWATEAHAIRYFCSLIQIAVVAELTAFRTTSIVSLQEMNVAIIERYFDFLRRNLRSNDPFHGCKRE